MEKLRKISTMSYLRQIVACLLVYCVIFVIPAQVALADPNPVDSAHPSGWTAPYGGSAGTVGNTTTITAPNGSVFNWDNFDIGKLHTVDFVHSVNESVLNRVNAIDGMATGINGHLNALGNVFVVNPMGIVIGPAAFIQAQRFVASGLNMTDDNFRNLVLFGTIDELRFEGYDVGTLGVELKAGGQIYADTVGLIGKTVANAGIITSDTVVLAAGERVYLTTTEIGGKIFVEVADLVTPVPAEHTVSNTGTINAPGGDVLLAAGDIYSAAITGVGKLAAVANRNIALGGDFEVGEITLTADADGVDDGYVYATGTLTSTTGDIEISASDDTWIQLGVDIDAAEDLLLNNNTMVTPGKTFKAGQDVILADGKNMKGYGALTIEGDRDIVLGGAVWAYGTMTLKADADTVDHEPGAATGGIMLAKSTLSTIYGNIDIYGNAILLDNDVTAFWDLILNNDTDANPGIKLKAGNNVDSPAHLTAEGNLTIEATGGAITAHEIKMPAAPAPSATLTLTQYDKLDMEQNVTVINRTNTHLDATSFADSVTSIAAAKWLDIKAWAYEDIILSDVSGNITTQSLTAGIRDVKITAEAGKVYAEGTINAGRDVEITATDEGSAAIELNENVNAGQDILLNNNTWAANGVEIDAGRDVKVGWDETHERYDPKTLTGEGSLTVEADQHITLGGNVAASALTPGDLVLWADKNTDDEGDMTAYGTITNPGGDIDIYSSDGTTELWDDVILSGDLTLHNSTVMKAAGKILRSTDDDVILAADKTLASDYDLTIQAADDILLGITNVVNHWGVNQQTGSGGNVSANGDLILNAGDDIYAHGSLTSSGGSNVDLTAVYDIRLYGPVTAEDNIYITAVSGDDNGTLEAFDSLTANTGEINILTDFYMELFGPVYAYTDLTLNADTASWNDGYIDAHDTLTAETGNIVGTADNNIWFEDVATAGGNITLDADSDDILAWDNDDLSVHGLVAGGNIDLSAGDSTIYIYESADLGASADVDADGDILLHNNTVTSAGVVLDAGDDVVLAGGKTLEGLGALTVQATDDIMFGITDVANHETTTITPASGSPGDVSADGTLIVNAGGSVYAYGTLKTDPPSGGNIEISSSNTTTYLYGDKIEADGSILLNNNTQSWGDIIAGQDVTLNGTLELKGTGPDADQEITATTGKLLAKDWVHKTSTGNLDMFGGYDGPYGSGDFSVRTKGVRVENGELDIAGNAYVKLDGDLYSTGRMELSSNDNDVLVIGWLNHTSGTIKSVNDDVDIEAVSGAIYLYGGNPTEYVTAGGDILLRSNTQIAGNRKLDAGDDVVLASGRVIGYHGAGPLTIEAGDDIMFGVDIATHEINPTTGTAGDVTADGHLILSAGDDIYAHGTLSTDTDSSGNITATAVDNIMLYKTPDSVLADGTLSLTSNTGAGSGVLYAAGNLTGNMYLYGYDVTVLGNVTSYGTLDIDADDDIELRANVSSVDEMTMDAGSDIALNRSSGNTSSESTITLTAGDDVTIGGPFGDEGNVTANGNMNITAGGDSDDDVKVFGKLTTTDSGNIDVRSGDGITIHGTQYVEYESVEADGILTMIANTSGNGLLGGNLHVAGSVQGNMYLAGTNVTVDGDVTSFGTLDVDADKNIKLKKNVSSEDAMTMNAGKDIRLNQDGGETVSDSTVTLIAGRDVKVEGNLTTTGDNDVGNTLVEADSNIKFGGNVNVDGHLEAYSGLADYYGAGSIEAYGDVIADSMQLEAGAGLPDYSDSHVQVDGLLQTTVGDMVVRAHHDILLGGNVDSAGNLVLNADRHGDYGYPEPHIMGGDVDVVGTVDAVGTIDMYGNNIMLDDNVTSGGNMTLTADTSSDFEDPLPEGDVIAMGNLTSTGGSIEIYSSDDTTYLGGDGVQAYGNILLNNNTVFTSYDDQKVDAQTGMITANGWLWKDTDGGSLYLEAAGDVSLADFVKADAGGVSIVSETGTIFTPDEFGDPTDTLNVPISGYSNDETGAGVDLPYGPGKAAIVIISEEDLKLGEGAVLTAFGTYDNSGEVDDRAAIDFLDDGDPLTATIGGVLRDEGDPFDAAIYLASTDGNVDVSGPVSITSDGYPNGEPVFEPQGAMVIDAFDSVTFGAPFEVSLANGDVGDRLEVVSRITEWLFQAVGRLPYPYSGGPFPLDYTYVLRGAGLDNLAITDGRAWVLEDPTPPAPLYQEAGQAAEELTLGVEGCPVLVAAASAELGIPADTIQVSLANSFALNTNIQPCESCARLLNAAAILSDEDGSRMAAMNQVFNELAPAGAPFTPEVAASIVTAFAGRVNDGTQYATAIEYIDAFVRYIAVLDTEMGSPVGDDSIAFLMGKYGTGITASENNNIAAFVAARLESGETFGD